MTPTVLREGPYRVFFYASDGEEPPHVHVRRDNQTAKFWLDPVRCQRSGGLRRPEVRRIARIIQRRQPLLMGAWDAYFDR